MLIYTYTALIFGFIYGMGILYYNSRSNEQFYTFLNPSDEFIKTFINGLFVGFIFILIMLITAGAMPLLILEGAYKWIKKKEK
jgi:hypothetical protein